MQRGLIHRPRRVVEFQSSPALSGRCNVLGRDPEPRELEFQSSPALSGRCNKGEVEMLASIALFQSSPALSGRCNAPGSPSAFWRWSGFNPHRPFRAGATRGLALDELEHLVVSILTGPFGPVQPWTWRNEAPSAPMFQSSPALSGRCNLHQLFFKFPRKVGFQSSPALSGRCNSPLYRSPPDGQEGDPSRRPPSRDPCSGVWRGVPEPVFKLHHGLRRLARTPRGFCAHLGFAHCPHHRMYGPQSPHP